MRALLTARPPLRSRRSWGDATVRTVGAVLLTITPVSLSELPNQFVGNPVMVPLPTSSFDKLRMSGSG